MEETRQETLNTVQNLNNELKEERLKIMDLEAKLRDAQNDKDKNIEVFLFNLVT